MDKNKVSLLEFLFSGEILNNVFIIIILLLGIVAFYLFFFKYFQINSNRKSDLLSNIADCMYDDRMESAIDWCKKVVSSESRIIKKGLDKISRSSFEIFVSVVNQREIEFLDLRKSVFKFNILFTLIILLGVLGTMFSLLVFFNKNEIIGSKQFYTCFFPIFIGMLLCVALQCLKMILFSMLNKFENELIIKSNKFLEIISEIKSEVKK